MTETAQIVRFDETGDASVLKLVEEPVTEPGPDELRIKVEAIGLNRAEVMFRSGAYLEDPTFPSKLGYEASGVVEAVGSDVSEFAVGDRVSTIPAFGMSEFGVYGTHAVVPAFAVAKYPDNLSAVEGTSIWMQYITAYCGLVGLGKLKPSDVVLITAASSSVGLAAIHIAKSIGATVIAATRGSSKVDSISAAGADHIVQTDHEDVAAKAAQITGGAGVNLVFDPIGGPLLAQLADAAAMGAMIIEYGALDEAPTPYPLFPALAKGLTIRGYTLFEVTRGADRAPLEEAVSFISKALAAGDFKPVIDRTFPLAEIAAAHRHLESNQQTGKIVVTV